MREKKFTPNDNGSVIRMLSAKYARCNRGRNRILLGAVALSIVTLTIIFGISYGRIRAEYIRSARKAGTDSLPKCGRWDISAEPGEA